MGTFPREYGGIGTAPGMLGPCAQAEPGKGMSKGWVEQRTPLEVAGIRMPVDALEQSGDVTCFGIVVQAETGKQWKIGRLYSHFDELFRALGSAHPEVFPPKQGGTPQERHMALERWLQRVIRNPKSQGEWTRPLRKFLDVSKQLPKDSTSGGTRQHPDVGRQPTTLPGADPAEPMQTTPLVGGQSPQVHRYEQAAQALATQVNRSAQETPSFQEQPATRPLVPPEPSAPMVNDSASLLQIGIPDDVAPGQLLAVTVPDGRVIDFAVPQGVASGTTLQLEFDPRSGTFTPVL